MLGSLYIDSIKQGLRTQAVYSKGNKEKNGGRGEIRTLGGRESSAVFKTAAINQLDHSSVIGELY
jgi:hypothetical protein